MGRSREWWPLSDSDPVPGDPEALAALGSKMRTAAMEIERLANTLPRLAASEDWDSEAGRQFTARATTVAAAIGRTHRRFTAVAAALGHATHGGTGYAAQLQHCQDQADAAASMVTGTVTTSGSEQKRLRTWNQLLDATGGLDPASHLPAGKTTGSTAHPAVVLVPPLTPRHPAGPFPQARPGYIPTHLPSFHNDPADVTALKRAYNAQLDQLSTAARQVSAAAATQRTAAHAAAQAIRGATGSDGLNNAPWYDRLADDVRGYVAAHWVGFVHELATIAGDIATVCGIIALVLAFIPGMEEFAALFETVALLAQAVSFACHALLLATGHGSLLDVVVDGIGLITFGIGKGLIGNAEATVKVSKAVGSAYEDTIQEGGGSVTSMIKAGDNAFDSLKAEDHWSAVSKFREKMNDVVSVRPVFSKALKAWQDGNVGKAFDERPLSTLRHGVMSAFTMRSPEIGSAFAETVEATNHMDVAQGIRWVLTSRVESYGQLFRVVQGVGLGSDIGTRVATTLSDHHLPPPGFDSIKGWPMLGGG